MARVVGDNVELNQIIADVEPAKAAVELPSPVAGVVAVLHAGSRRPVAVGAPRRLRDDGG